MRLPLLTYHIQTQDLGLWMSFYLFNCGITCGSPAFLSSLAMSPYKPSTSPSQSLSTSFSFCPGSFSCRRSHDSPLFSTAPAELRLFLTTVSQNACHLCSSVSLSLLQVLSLLCFPISLMFTSCTRLFPFVKDRLSSSFPLVQPALTLQLEHIKCLKHQSL